MLFAVAGSPGASDSLGRALKLEDIGLIVCDTGNVVLNTAANKLLGFVRQRRPQSGCRMITPDQAGRIKFGMVVIGFGDEHPALRLGGGEDKVQWACFSPDMGSV